MKLLSYNNKIFRIFKKIVDALPEFINMGVVIKTIKKLGFNPVITDNKPERFDYSYKYEDYNFLINDENESTIFISVPSL